MGENDHQRERGSYHVLFLCTHNSARSVMAEALLNHLGAGRMRAFSAGSAPGAGPHPLALEQISAAGLPSGSFRSKSWDEFARPGAPAIDLVITVCDSAARESCPVWPGHPLVAHWGMPDPSAVQGDEQTRRNAFAAAWGVLAGRIRQLVHLPVDELDRATLREKVAAIGRAAAAD